MSRISMSRLQPPPTRRLARWCRSRYRGFAKPRRLANLEPFKLRVPEIEGLIVAGPMMRGPERLGLGPRLEDCPILPHRV